MANSPARALRIIAEYAKENAEDCNVNREFPAAGVWSQLEANVTKVHAWTLDFVELV
jgi:3-deoxy-D-arabino-heptulosonate 7-phosphate (DAHP) synthase class II